MCGVAEDLLNKQNAKCRYGRRTKSDWTELPGGSHEATLFGPQGFLHKIDDSKTDVENVRFVKDGTLWKSTTQNQRTSFRLFRPTLEES